VTPADALAARLLVTFLGEFEEQLLVMNADLLALEGEPADPERLKSLFRVAHTLKGAARAAQVPEVEGACHALESLLAAARDGKVALKAAHFERLFSAADALADAQVRLTAGESLSGAAVGKVAVALAGAGLDAAFTTASRAPKAAGRADGAVPAALPALRRTDGQVRVGAEMLDSVLAAAGQLFVVGGSAATRPARAEAMREAAARASARWRRSARGLRLVLERAGASPSETQALADVDAELRRLAQDADHLAGELTKDARALARVSDDMLGGVRRLRMRPFSDACESLPRAIRDLAASQGKEAQLKIDGGEVLADRAVLDGLREALLPLVRNAVDHGIEAPAARAGAGKSRSGQVTVAAALRADRIVVTVSDDGAGLDVAAIRALLVRRGLPIPSDEREMVRAIFDGGLTTNAEVTKISGRGVGLDIVRAAVAGIRGSIEVAWQAGAGTTFALTCPPVLASIRALLVTVGSQVLAIPVSHVERVLRVRPEDMRRGEGQDLLAGERPIPLVALARLMPPLPERPVSGVVAAAVLVAGERRLAVVVDELTEAREIMLQPLRHGPDPLPLISGAAMLDTGRVALILDPAAVVAAGLSLRTPGVVRAEAAAGPARRTVLVVDDSLTTRTLEQSILEAAGYDVVTAADGVEGWRAIQERGADAVVADIEMPRMDGFALCEAIRSAKRLTRLPVILVTALETPEHRARGLAVGADAYIGKSSFDQKNLLDTLRQLLAQEDR
jgi:two-component system chemotaxis sensor kinase CheA